MSKIKSTDLKALRAQQLAAATRTGRTRTAAAAPADEDEDAADEDEDAEDDDAEAAEDAEDDEDGDAADEDNEDLDVDAFDLEAAEDEDEDESEDEPADDDEDAEDESEDDDADAAADEDEDESEEDEPADDEDESEDDEAEAADDEDESEDEPSEDEDAADDKPVTAAWLEENVIAGLLEASIHGIDVDTRTAAVEALQQSNHTAGALFLDTLTGKEWARFHTIVADVNERGMEVLAQLQSLDARAEDVKEALLEAGKRREARQMDEEYQLERTASVENGDMDFVVPDWLDLKVAAFIEAEDAESEDDESADEDEDAEDDDAEAADEEEDEDAEPADDEDAEDDDAEAADEEDEDAAEDDDADESEDDEAEAADEDEDEPADDEDADADKVDPEDSAEAIAAMVVAQLVTAGKPKKAARFLLNTARPDAKRAVLVVASLHGQGKIDLAAAMVSELRSASFNVNPDIKPVSIDPTQPSSPGANRGTGPAPDGGFSYGGELSPADLERACSTLACEASALSWIAERPSKNRFEVFTQTPGRGRTQTMTTAEAKEFIAQKSSETNAVILANVSEFDELGSDDVVMTLHASAEEDPFWNVILAGMPVGQIHLADQDRPESIRGTFISAVYGEGIRESITRSGAETVLNRLGTRLYASAYKISEEVTNTSKQIREAAAVEAGKLVKAHVEETLDLMLLAHEGYARGIYAEDNPLFWAGTQALSEAGVRDPAGVFISALTMPILADGDDEENARPALAAYMTMLHAKAEELRDLEPKALQQITGHILGTPISLPDGSRVADATQTLRQRLAGANFPVQAVGADEEPSGRPMTRDALRAKLKVGNKYRETR